ncbi:MAG: ubiquinol-cytochrome c reductase iron-sulfur subunit [Blastocatellia bacterium]|nr:ubiquinol-cytochrome c reductase iron-sulfur subunit [Blastocatellia bacterium]
MNSETKMRPVTEASHSTTTESLPEDRRSFLGIVIGLIASSITVVLGSIIGRYTIAPALSAAGQPEWADAGLLDEIPEGEPVKRNVVVSQEAGWGRFNSQQLVWVLKQGNDITVFSAVCPHLGCSINHAQKGFICPCHGSAWDAEGKKLGGPAPRGMDVLEHRVEGGLLKVRYQYFQQGADQKKPLV